MLIQQRKEHAMLQIIRLLVAIGIAVSLIWQSIPVHAQHVNGLNTTLILQMGSSTKTLDLGTGHGGNDEGSQTPPNWATPSFDDSSWPTASTATISCTTGDWSQDYQKIGSPTLYWGDNPADDYLFRQDFTLPLAKNYYSSSLNLKAIGENGNTPMSVYVNGTLLDNQTYVDHTASASYAIGAYLRAGQNVVGIVAPFGNSGQYSSRSDTCAGLAFTITARVTDLQNAPPAHKPRATLSTILPGQNAVLSGSSTLPFSWNRYAGARYYYLQFWLVNPASGQRITSRSVTTYTARLTGTSYTLNTHAMPKGTYQWRMAAVSGSGKLLSPWTAEQRVTLK